MLLDKQTNQSSDIIAESETRSAKFYKKTPIKGLFNSVENGIFKEACIPLNNGNFKKGIYTDWNSFYACYSKLSIDYIIKHPKEEELVHNRSKETLEQKVKYNLSKK